MWRGNLLNEDERIRNFSKDVKKINKLFKSLKQKKIIKKFYVFPYTKSFLKVSKKYKVFDGACIYRNPIENEYVKLISKFKKFKFIAIRPFGGNLKLAKKHNLKYLLNYSINNKKISKVILACSKKKQIKEIVSYCDGKKSF